MKKDIIILGIETSCDETAASVVLNGRVILSNIIFSQIDLHKKYGGVVPELASRSHIENISFVVEQAIKKAQIEFCDIDAIAVTYGPGLVGALLVGLSYAKGLSFSLNIPLVGVHHIKGHICSNYLENNDFKPPYVCLVVSGGHTNLIEIKDYLELKTYGTTRDDAVGEAFDKVARVLELGYPGGPKIDKLSQNGKLSIEFPKSYLEEESYDFSFSGIKSAVINYVNKTKMQGLEIVKEDIAYSFQHAVVEVIVEKSIKLCKTLNYKTIAIAGGVSCNSFLRQSMLEACKKQNISLKTSDFALCTDNAAMIASAGYFQFINTNTSEYTLNAHPNLKLGF